MGCYFTKLALLSGARRVIVAEPSPERREIVKKFGAIVTEPENLENVVKSETRRGADIAIDACGVPEVINQAIELVRPGGKISTFGEQNIRAFGNHVSFTEVTNKELKIIGSFAAVLSLDQTVTVLKEMNLSELITHRISLEEIHTGIELMRKGKGIKIIVYPTKR
jgi:threonine dehydrogenase-like Zn-dependent dehydrogenase